MGGAISCRRSSNLVASFLAFSASFSHRTSSNGRPERAIHRITCCALCSISQDARQLGLLDFPQELAVQSNKHLGVPRGVLDHLWGELARPVGLLVLLVQRMPSSR